MFHVYLVPADLVIFSDADYVFHTFHHGQMRAVEIIGSEDCMIFILSLQAYQILTTIVYDPRVLMSDFKTQLQSPAKLNPIKAKHIIKHIDKRNDP